jgi:hypothetical protein
MGLRVRLVILLTLIVLLSVPIHSDADETPCIIMTKAGEWYIIGLNGMTDTSEVTICLRFDHQLTVAQRLEVQGSFRIENDLLTNSIYYIKNSSSVLCTVQYEGVNEVLFGETRARLEITSDNYYVHLIGIQFDAISTEFDVPPSFQIVLALCSLVPFFLLMPDAINDLQMQLDTETMSKGVYGRILSLLLPLLSIALTLLLLGGLYVF